MDLNVLIIGILLIIGSGILYLKSFLFFRKGKTLNALLIIIAVGFFLRLFCSLDSRLHTWDERYHALVAKNMMVDPFEPKLYKEHITSYNYKDWTSNKVWLHKQPFPLWMMALSMKVFGVNEIAARLPSIIFSTLGIFLTFFIGKNLFNEKVGIIASFFYSINGLIIELASGRVTTDHVDIAFLFLVNLSIVFILAFQNTDKKRYLLLTGVACGLAILSKWLIALIILPLFLVLNYDKKITTIITGGTIILIIAMAISLPWQLYCYSNFQDEYLWEQSFNFLHFVSNIEGHGQPWWFHLDRIRIVINELIYVALLWFIFQFTKKGFSKQEVFIALWFLIPLVIFSIAKTKMQGYLLFSFPAYFIILALFINELIALSKKESGNRKKMYQLIIALTLLLSFRYGMERIKPFQSNTESNLKTALTKIDIPSNSIIFNIKSPIETMFYTNCLAYPFIPKKELINDLENKGYKVFIVNDNLSPTIRNSKQIQLLDIPKNYTLPNY